MPERVLSDEEVKKLGLEQPKKERELSDAEAQGLGLDAAVVPESGNKPSVGRSVAEGLVQGGSYGFGDELQGLIGALITFQPLTLSLNQIGDLLTARRQPGDLETALGHYKRSLEIREKISAASPESARTRRPWTDDARLLRVEPEVAV